MTKKEFIERWGTMTLAQLGDYIAELEETKKDYEDLRMELMSEQMLPELHRSFDRF